MSQMLDLIKSKSVPAAVMRSAAKGALSVPAAEMLEILVYLSENPILGKEAILTLAAWDEISAISVLSSNDAPQAVLDYFWQARNRRAALMPALLNHPRIPEQRLIEMAATASGEELDWMLASPRVQSLPRVLQILQKNPHGSSSSEKSKAEETGLDESEIAHQAFQQDHAAEISNEEKHKFELITSSDGPEEPAATAQPQPAEARQEKEKLTTLVRIARMNVAERVKAAFVGTKDERAILIRDAARVVQNAVLASPKISEPEVETFAAAKNVDENVLRQIARNRRFMKSYAVQRNLVQNPKCPLDISLSLVKNLLVYDLKGLRASKSVPETIRKVAASLYHEKMNPRDK
jgi:hypothetical protein